MIKIYDTKLRQKVEFQPKEPGKISMSGICSPVNSGHFPFAPVFNHNVGSISEMRIPRETAVGSKKPSLKNAAFALKPSAICIGGSLPR